MTETSTADILQAFRGKKRGGRAATRRRRRPRSYQICYLFFSFLPSFSTCPDRPLAAYARGTCPGLLWLVFSIANCPSL